jgi:outer membrane protein OmpA-like peptidoglycan-associated protein
MRILTTGAVVFVIWSFFSTWLYVDVLRHAAKKPVTEQAIPETRNATADSLARLYAMMPKELMIYFEFDKFKLKPDPQLEPSLGDFRSWLDKYPESVLQVTGYTDLVGDAQYNQDLGLKRAQEVQKYLEAKGFPVARLNISSKGENDPAAGYITAEERAKNRRVVISIKK